MAHVSFTATPPSPACSTPCCLCSTWVSAIWQLTCGRWRPFGLHWDQVSTPFIMMKDGRLISHVGVLDLPLIVDGCDVLVGGIHAVCTHPDHRRQGYYRAVMEEALAWCDERYETLMLIASILELYEPFGFRVIPESRFVGSVRHVDQTPNLPELRQLDLHRPDDLQLLHRLLDQRAPVFAPLRHRTRPRHLPVQPRRQADLVCPRSGRHPLL